MCAWRDFLRFSVSGGTEQIAGLLCSNVVFGCVISTQADTMLPENVRKPLGFFTFSGDMEMGIDVEKVDKRL